VVSTDHKPIEEHRTQRRLDYNKSFPVASSRFRIYRTNMTAVSATAQALDILKALSV
jgi:hypothetical protein